MICKCCDFKFLCNSCDAELSPYLGLNLKEPVWDCTCGAEPIDDTEAHVRAIGREISEKLIEWTRTVTRIPWGAAEITESATLFIDGAPIAGKNAI